jgi:hypothetical protein
MAMQKAYRPHAPFEFSTSICFRCHSDNFAFDFNSLLNGNSSRGLPATYLVTVKILEPSNFFQYHSQSCAAANQGKKLLQLGKCAKLVQKSALNCPFLLFQTLPNQTNQAARYKMKCNVSR